MGPSLAGYGIVARAGARRVSSGKVSLLRIGEDVWSWFQAAETTSQAADIWSWIQAAETPSQAAVPTEPEAAQSLLGPMGNLGRGENLGSAAILSQDALE